MINDKSISGDKQTNRNENEMKLLTKRRGLSRNNFTALFWKRGLEKFEENSGERKNIPREHNLNFRMWEHKLNSKIA